MYGGRLRSSLSRPAASPAVVALLSPAPASPASPASVVLVSPSAVRAPTANAAARRTAYEAETTGFGSLKELECELELKCASTSGYHNNCLIFSTYGSAGLLDSNPANPASVNTDAIREEIHYELLDKLPEEPSNLSFKTALTRSRAIEIFEQDEFMEEAHTHVISNLLARPIVVVDMRFRAAQSMTLFIPGYTPQKPIGKTRARELRNDSEVIWILLRPNHFSALLRRTRKAVWRRFRIGARVTGVLQLAHRRSAERLYAPGAAGYLEACENFEEHATKQRRLS